MLYELRIDTYVEDIHDYADVRDKLHDILHKMKVIKPGGPAQQCSVIDVIENHHDESPASPCILRWHWDNCPAPPP